MSTAKEKTESPAAGASPRRPWLKYALIGIASLVVLLVLTVIGLRLYFSDTYIKSQVMDAMQKALGRPCAIGGLEASLLDGHIVLRDISVHAPAGQASDPAPFSLARADVKLALWNFLFSSFSECKGVRVELDGLNLGVARRMKEGQYVTNWDDVIAKLTSGPPGTWPKSTGLKALEYQLRLKNSKLRFDDEQYGTSSVEGLSLDASQSGLGELAAFKLAGALQTPRNASPGKILLEGSVIWIDEQGRVGPTTVHKAASSISMQDADLGQLAQYAGVQGTAKDGEMRWTLGQRFSGELKADAPELDDLHLTFALETDELMAVRRIGEETKQQTGLLPAKVEATLSGGWTNGTMAAGPLNVSLDVAASTALLKTPGGPRWISFRMGSQKASAGDEPFSLSLQTDITALCSSRIGETLGLKNQYGGRLDARANVSRSTDGLHAKGNLKTEEFFVAMEGERQSSGLQLDYDLAITRNAQGRIDQVTGTLAAQARPFQITTIQPLLLKSISTPEKMEGTAQLNMVINGRELWKEFGPLLKIVNMGSPLEEALEGQLSVSSEAGKLSGSFQGTLQRQNQDPRPIILNVGVHSELAARERMDGSPFADFNVKLKANDHSFDVQMSGLLSRTKTEETWDLSEFKALGSLAAIGDLNRRLGKYVSFFLGPEYDVKGLFTQKATSKLVRHLAADGSITSQSVNIVTDLTLQQFDLRGPALVKDGLPLHWEEKEDVSLHLELVQGVKQVAGAGLRDTVAIPSVLLKSGSLNLDGSLAEAEVASLSHAADATSVEERFKRWMAAMPSAKLDASVNQASVKRLQDLGILPPEPLLTGSLRIKAAHDATTHRVDVEKLDLLHTDWTLGLTLQGLGVESLGTVLNQPGKGLAAWQKAAPSFAAQASLKPAGVERLQTLFKEIRIRATPATRQPAPTLLWEDPALIGQLDLALNYNAAKGTLTADSLTFTSADTANLKITAPAIQLASILSFLDRDRKDLAAAGALLTDCAVDLSAGPRLFNLFKQYGLLPKGLDLAGLLQLRTRYQQEKDRLLLDQFDFTRAQGSACLITKFALTKPKGEPEEVTALRGLLTELDVSKPMNELLGTVATHMEAGIHLQELEVSTSALLTYLRSQGLAAGFIEAIERGVYRLTDTIRFSAMSARKDLKASRYELFAALEAGAGWHPLSGTPAAPQKDPAATLVGTLKLNPVVVTVDPLRVDADATIFLDDLHVNFAYATPYFVYEKPAGMPCRFRFAAGLPAKGGMVVSDAALTGGPLTVTIKDFQQSAEGALTCELLEFRDGPLPGKLTGFLLDTQADHLRVAFDANSVDMASAVKYASLPKTFVASGSLEKIHGSYDGRVSVLPDRMGEQDKAEIQCVLREVMLSGRPLGKSADLSINGALNASPYLLASRKLDVGLNYGVTGQPAIAQRMSVAVERVSAREPRVALPSALLADGLPLLVRGQLQAETPCDVSALLDGIATLSESLRTETVQKEGPSDLSGINKLRLELSVAAPAVVMGDQTLRNLQVPQILFDKLNLSIPLANAEAYGGQLILREALYNVGVAPITHTQKFAVSDVDLHAITSDPTKPVAKDSYQVFGKLNATGSMSGAGFLQRERASWQGEFKVKINDLIAQKGDGKAQQESVSKKAMGMLGGVLGGMGGLSGELGRGMALYGDDFGLFLTRLEFEPCEINMSMDRGRVRVPQGQLTGKGRNTGLQLAFMGYADLPTETFTPSFYIWPASFTPATQKMMKLDQLTPANRETIQQEFRSGTYKIVLTGPITAPTTNAKEFAVSFYGVLDKIDRMIAAQKQGATPGTGTGASTGAGAGTNTSAEKKPEFPLPFKIPSWLSKDQ